MTSTETRLRDLVVLHFGCDDSQVVTDASFQADLGADSLDTVEICMSVEDLLGIELSDDEADAAIGSGTFGDLCRLVDGKMTARTSTRASIARSLNAMGFAEMIKQQTLISLPDVLDDWARFVAEQHDPEISADRLEASMGIDARKLKDRIHKLGLWNKRGSSA